MAPISQEAAAPVELADGETITMKGTAMGAKEKMESGRLEEMAILDRIGFVPGEKLKAPDNRPVPEESLKVLQAALTTGRSLAEIRKTYGSVSVIKTTDGKTYTGYFKQSGRMIDIITEKGTVTIPSSSIKKVSAY